MIIKGASGNGYWVTGQNEAHMLKINGLNNFQKDLNDIARALKALDGPVGRIDYDPSDPDSVKAAIRRMERLVDGKITRYRNNPMVAKIASAAKSNFKSAILKRAKIKALKK